MRFSVVGANSFIARNFIFYLKKHHPDVDLFLYDIQDKHMDNVDNYNKINVLDSDDTNRINYDVDLIYCFTGKTGTIKGFDEYRNYIDINEVSLLNILNSHRIKELNSRIIFPSTRLVYKGKNGLVDEESEKEFKTVYSINKYACEQYLKMYKNMYNINYTIFRICVPYGTMIDNISSYGTAEFMLSQAKQGKNISLYGGGKVRRTLTHIMDLCRALYEGGISKQCENEVYNIGGEDYSLFEMANKIAEVFKIRVIESSWPDDQLRIESGNTVFDSSKFDNTINYKYNHLFDEWIKQSYSQQITKQDK